MIRLLAGWAIALGIAGWIGVGVLAWTTVKYVGTRIINTLTDQRQPSYTV